VWLKAGGDWSHGHADLCSAFVRLDDDWVIDDPGTGTYNGPADQRDYFRTSIAHPVLRLDGLDQLEPHRAFRWRYDAVGSIGAPITTTGSVVLWGWHGSYRRLDPSRRIVRAVVLGDGDGRDPASATVTVIDWVEGPPGMPFALSLPLPPDATFDGAAVRLSSRRVVPLSFVTAAPTTVTTRDGQVDPFDGWSSPRYGTVEPSVRVELSGRLDGPVAWQLRAAPAGAPASSPGTPAIEDGAVTMGDLSLQVAFRDTSVDLACRPSRSADPEIASIVTG
jgi:hypothetical protein